LADWLVLKPHADESEIDWLVDLCGRATFDGLRVPAPVPATHGRFVVDGWYATTFTPGDAVPDHEQRAEAWAPVLAAGRRFHTAVRDESPPQFLDQRAHRWAVADQIAWSDAAPALPPQIEARRRQLHALTQPEELPEQLIHGDLSGNVLLAPDHAPAIIDISPYWRPAAYADAIVVIDALLWWRTDSELIDLATPADVTDDIWTSLLARAAVFRLLASSVAFDPDSPAHAEELQQFDAIIHQLGRR
jgi:uncharacterized protein (TIGR02569 family)